MISMWDSMFIFQDNSIQSDLQSYNGIAAFNKMHNILNKTWIECDRVLKNHGFICINIGDATRTLNDNFCLYSNHTKIIEFFLSLGYNILPDIIWNKPTNSLNKFMGSGMFPAGAYITLEHEYILIFRKGDKKKFKGKELEKRHKSAYFYEERNQWFTDIWKMSGTSQKLKGVKTRDRSGAYPIEIPYRLVNMYSLQGDLILDPFCGLGTTNLACMTACRNSIGIEVDEEIAVYAKNRLCSQYPSTLNRYTNRRIENHKEYLNALTEEQKEKFYINKNYNLPVKTKQEVDLYFPLITKINKGEDVVCEYGGIE